MYQIDNSDLREFFGDDDLDEEDSIEPVAGDHDNVSDFLWDPSTDDTFVRRQLQNFPYFYLTKGDVKGCVLTLDWLCEPHRNDYLEIALNNLKMTRDKGEFRDLFDERITVSFCGNQIMVGYGRKVIVVDQKVITLGQLCDFKVDPYSDDEAIVRKAYDGLGQCI